MKVNGDFASTDAEATKDTEIFENDSLRRDEVVQTSLDDFLSALFPNEDEEIWLRTFKAKGAPAEPHGFPRTYSVTRAKLKEDAEFLHELQQLNQTHGIYFVVNSGGNKDEEIFLFNCFFAEIDDKPIAEQHAILDNAPIPPNIRVETRKSVHAYWLPHGGINKQDWLAVQKGLIAYLGSDPKIKNPSRLMRLPGFNHVQFREADESYSYKPVITVKFNPRTRHTAEEMLEAFPPPPEELVRKRMTSGDTFEQESSPRVSQELLDRYSDGPEPDLTTWDSLNRATARRILSHETATVSGDGEWAHAKGICHNGVGNSGLFVNLETGAYGCQNECSTAQIRQAFDLPISPPDEATEERGRIGFLWGEFSQQHFSYTEEVITGLRRGEVGELVAATNIGKTTLALNIALKLSAGYAFPPFVKERGQPKRVLFIDGESTRAVLQRDLKRMMREWHEEQQQLVGSNLLLIVDAEIDSESLSLSNPKHMAQVRAEAERFQPDLIIIDTLSALFAVDDENHNAEMKRRVMQPLKNLAKDTNAAVFLLHHVGKQSEEAQSGNKAYRGRGASVVGALSRLVLLLTPDKHEKGRVFLTCPKSKGPCFEDLVMKLDPDSRWFTVTDETPPKEISSYELVVSTVLGFSREVKRGEIDKALHGRLSVSTITRELSEAVKRGNLETAKHGWYQAPVNAQMLKPIGNDVLNIQNAFSLAA